MRGNTWKLSCRATPQPFTASPRNEIKSKICLKERQKKVKAIRHCWSGQNKAGKQRWADCTLINNILTSSSRSFSSSTQCWMNCFTTMSSRRTQFWFHWTGLSTPMTEQLWSRSQRKWISIKLSRAKFSVHSLRIWASCFRVSKLVSAIV